MPRILSGDKNLACTKTYLLVSALFYFCTILFFAHLFWCATGHNPILFVDMLSRTLPNIGLDYFEAPFRFAKDDKSAFESFYGLEY